MKKAIAYWWNYFWMMTLQNPKSTFSGVFSFFGLISAGLLTMVPADYKKATFIVTCVSAVCKLYMLCISPDPNKQLAKVPGVAAPQVVDSHELPDDSKNKAVKK